MGNVWEMAVGAPRWPVTLEQPLDDDATITLVPLRRRWRRQWSSVREDSREWLVPWEATTPPGQVPPVSTFGEFVSMMTKLARRGETLPWLMVRRAGAAQELVGQLTVSRIAGGSASCCQIGYWVSRRVAGQGITPLATAMAADYCLGVLGLHRVEIAIRPENAASLRVVEKLGFRYEGVRERYLHINGAWRDHRIFALTAEEISDGGLVGRFREYQQGRQTTVDG